MFFPQIGETGSLSPSTLPYHPEVQYCVYSVMQFLSWVYIGWAIWLIFKEICLFSLFKRTGLARLELHESSHWKDLSKGIDFLFLNKLIFFFPVFHTFQVLVRSMQNDKCTVKHTFLDFGSRTLACTVQTLKNKWTLPFFVW